MASADVSSGLVAVSTDPDIRIYYEVTPATPFNPSRPTILLSNSLAASTRLWDIFVSAFAPTHTIIRYDPRFHGRSPLSSTPDFDYVAGHSVKDLADDAVKLLDHLQLQKVDTFIGLSIGGAVGVVLAAKYPQRFGSFVIVGTKAAKGPGDDAAHDARIKLAREQGMLVQGKQSVGRWFPADWIPAHPQEAEQVAQMVASQNVEGFIASVQALRRLDLWNHAEEIRTSGTSERVLFVVGEKDNEPVVRESKELATKTGSEIVIVEDTGHIANVQVPERFHEVVRAWLDKQR